MGAKKQSNRLYAKNYRDVGGKPMFVWNLEKALRLFNEVYVSSDSQYILTIAENMGAIPIMRPSELCGETPNIDWYNHALKQIDCDAFVAIQANSPTLELEKIELVLNLMKGIEENEPKQEVKTCHNDMTDYGSIWAMTKERCLNYENPRKAKPDLWIKDESVDIHTIMDVQKAILDLELKDLI